MKKDVADKWVAALRSGEYPQARGGLHIIRETQSGPGFCCLGVLCDLFTKVDPGHCRWTNISKLPDEDSTRFFIECGSELSTTAVPQRVQSWSGLRSGVGYCTKPSLADTFGYLNESVIGNNPSLANANDNGASFEQIADFIEQYWQDL
jgi:hypothetical protein